MTDKRYKLVNELMNNSIAQGQVSVITIQEGDWK